MGWLDRYQTWQPERSWDRYQARRLESRPRYVSTSVALRALIVLFFLLLTGSSLGRALLVTAIFVAVAVPLWFWYYARAKAKRQPASVATRATQV